MLRFSKRGIFQKANKFQDGNNISDANINTPVAKIKRMQTTSSFQLSLKFLLSFFISYMFLIYNRNNNFFVKLFYLSARGGSKTSPQITGSATPVVPGKVDGK